MRKFTALIIAVLVASWLVSAPVAGAAPPSPGPGAPGVGDPYYPLDGNGGYDVAHYDLAVSYRPATDVLRGRATMTARATQDLTRFNLDLDGLTVDRVRVNGARASWQRDGGELQITPSKALRKGSRFTVVVGYHGVPVTIEDVIGAGGVFPTADGAIIIGQPHVASTWFPVNDHPSDKASYAIKVNVPRGVEAIANGRLADVRRHRHSTTWIWVAKEPMASYLATATVGQFKLKAYKKGGLRYLDAIDPVLFVKPQPFGRRYAWSGSANSAYQRLARTFTVPASGGRLTFEVDRDTEPDWDQFLVEAHRVGSDVWTTLPDLNGHSTTDTGQGCPFLLELHPFLSHYQTAAGDECSATGSTGSWNAASGRSDGFETWSVDLAAYAGQQVEIALTVVTDGSVNYRGVVVDRVVGPGGQGSTSFEDDSDPLDGWAVPAAPPGSPGNDASWRRATAADLTSTGQRAQTVFKREPEIIKFLSTLYGRYPFRDVGGIVDNDPDFGFALENQTRPIYAQAFFAGGDAEGATSVVVHELSHQWTGDSLSVAQWQHIWLNEGFATYAEWLWSEHERQSSAQEIFDSFAGVPADDPFWALTIGDPGPEQLFDFPVYGRGAMTLHALRLRVGDDAFFAILKRWTSRRANANVTTAEFIGLAERISGQDLEQFFKVWLFTAAKPAGLEVSTAGRARVDTSGVHRSLNLQAKLRR